MVIEDKVKIFKKTNNGDVMGVVRTLFPKIEIETTTLSRRKNKS